MQSPHHLDVGGSAIAGCFNVEARHFHPMRGHVAEGVLVRFATGAIRRVANTMQGWTVTDGKQRQLFAPVSSATALTSKILELDAHDSVVDADAPAS